MLRIGEKKSNSGFRLNIKHYHKVDEFKMKEVFIGHKTLFTFAGVATGSTLIGRSIWELLYRDLNLGFLSIITIGAILLAISGFYLGNYHEESQKDNLVNKEKELKKELSN